MMMIDTKLFCIVWRRLWMVRLMWQCWCIRVARLPYNSSVETLPRPERYSELLYLLWPHRGIIR